MTELLKKKEIAPHVLAHLFRYIERRIFTGKPVLLIIDEAWKFLGDACSPAKLKSGFVQPVRGMSLSSLPLKTSRMPLTTP